MCEGFHVTNEVMYYSLLQHQNNILVLNLYPDNDGIWSHFWPSCFLYHRFTSIHDDKYLRCNRNTEKNHHMKSTLVFSPGIQNRLLSTLLILPLSLSNLATTRNT